MVNTKITNLSSLSAATGDELPVNRAGSDGKITVQSILDLAPGLVVEATTAHTLALTDAAKTLEFTASSACVLTIPSSTAANFADAAYVNITAKGSGRVSVTTGTNVTLLSKASARILSTQYSMATIYKSSANSWILGGDVSTA